MQPYQRYKGGRTVSTVMAKTQAIQIPSGPYLPPSKPASPESPPLSNGLDTAREMYMEFFEKTYPNIQPRDDYDLITLGSTRRKGTAAEIYAWADDQMRIDIRILGSREAVLANSTKVLDMVVGITGRKPLPGRDIVHTRPVPGSRYSIRLWPGNPRVNEYCMDFVDTATKEAVNSPFEFELWAVPDPEAPWLFMPSGRLNSLESNFHIPQHKIPTGEEKWVLRDGQTCVLKRPGKKDVLFRVPVREKPQVINPVDYDVLDFPRQV
ncbi:uncharacterized protein TRAVEDRAFT_161254 [Trametes versicolor FP-101664 SS1]|uniref:uncharacterized protein n=1 Tax=Trametes versicolor (strain FP-101664) TaxID=717944 RepID=UPI000462411E|nr:uncharacterized protein TRAVEDRAFT_161254 [Trametes versicolor FP-101664 SS1]EIW63142.1 hypothetical protein TRAVEDRAFT_161254 [Trametes versicolor FP-101664 SS1]